MAGPLYSLKLPHNAFLAETYYIANCYVFPLLNNFIQTNDKIKKIGSNQAISGNSQLR
ncbi:hypothetical protein P886_0176 [Alteromonadaceae bacterium 2753L.S.0a.02]|nr:hypothetical protein P886_0176 [Alteromonadaceae bacterium 2753L.S.0a.02]